MSKKAKISRKKLDHLVVAEGEHTGHKHQLTGGTLFMEENNMFVENNEEVEIKHEEHNPFVIPPSPTGEYQIGGVVEYDHLLEESRKVAD
jgi:hypothetical protein